jgi:hypothetical protein
VPVLPWSCRYLKEGEMKTNYIFFALIIFLLTAGCVQKGYLDGTSSSVAPAVVFEPSESSYLLSCVNELQGLTRKDFVSYSTEVAARLDQGGEEDLFKYICLSLHPKADYKQFKRGKKLLNQYIDEHSDSSVDMRGLLVLVKQLDRAFVGSFSGQNRMREERDRLKAKVTSLELESKQNQGQIQELQRQIDQLKNIENIIKNREHTK